MICYLLYAKVIQHERTVSELVSRIRKNARRYISLFSEVIDDLMPEPTKDISEHDEVIEPESKIRIDRCRRFHR